MSFGLFSYLIAFLFATLVESPLIMFEKQLSSLMHAASVSEQAVAPLKKSEVGKFRSKSDAGPGVDQPGDGSLVNSNFKRLHQLPQFTNKRNEQVHYSAQHNQIKLLKQPSTVIEDVEQF